MRIASHKQRATPCAPRLFNTADTAGRFVRAVTPHAIRVRWDGAWIANSAALLVLVVWIAIDPLWSGPASEHVKYLPTSAQALFDQARTLPLVYACIALALLGLVLISFVFWVGVSLLGSRHDRSIRSWMALTTNVALWIAFLATWNDIAWLGKGVRARHYIAPIAAISNDLRMDWPTGGGDSADYGPYMAYPITQPTSLILMTCPPVPKGMQTFNGAEKTPKGNVALPLVGNDGGDWLEWSSTGQPPDDFTTGLGQRMQLVRASKLDDHWFLVRYR